MLQLEICKFLAGDLLFIDVFLLFVSVLNQLHPISIYYHPTHQQQSDFLILVLYDFIVQNILSYCYNLMIMNDYE
jgi:hypothetical protein